MARALTETEAQLRRRRAADRMHGMFADVAADRRLVDELIAERRAEVQAEDNASDARPSRG